MNLVGARARPGGPDLGWEAPRFRPFSLADFYSISVEAGLRGLGSVPWSKAGARLLNPLSYTRFMEYELVLERLGSLSGKRILDIGSPKLLAFAIGRHCDTELVSVDIDPGALDSWARLWPRVAPRARAGRLRFEEADARALPYGDGSFDAVYSLSVVEHIPGEGDSAALSEMARVVRPGGVVVLTVPFDPNAYSEEFVEGGAFGRAAVAGPQFYQRRYDEVALRKRLSTPALVLERTDYFGEPLMSFELSWNRIPMIWKLPALWAQPLLAKLFLRRLGRDPRASSLGVALTYRKLETGAS